MPNGKQLLSKRVLAQASDPQKPHLNSPHWLPQPGYCLAASGLVVLWAGGRWKGQRSSGRLGALLPAPCQPHSPSWLSLPHLGLSFHNITCLSPGLIPHVLDPALISGLASPPPGDFPILSPAAGGRRFFLKLPPFLGLCPLCLPIVLEPKLRFLLAFTHENLVPSPSLSSAVLGQVEQAEVRGGVRTELPNRRGM